MTREERESLKAALDARVRELLADDLDRPTCAGCGADLGSYTTGCRSCYSRRRKRRLRDAPGGREAEAARSRRYRARKARERAAA